jgi:hypothetical protein
MQGLVEVLEAALEAVERIPTPRPILSGACPLPAFLMGINSDEEGGGEA